MKKRYLLTLVGVGLFLFINKNSNERQFQVRESQEKSDIAQRAPSAEAPETEEEKANIKSSPNPLAEIIQKHLPKQVPSALRNRMAHVPNFEDDRYLDTQLHLDGRPLENYFYKWLKDDYGTATELVAGTLPRITGVNGSFPAPSEINDIISAAVGSEGDIVSSEEQWALNSQRILNPQAKVHVQTKSRSQRSSGSEYWFINLNTGKIIKRIEADRF